jgi:flagellar hook-basal body complex protein FliE
MTDPLGLIGPTSGIARGLKPPGFGTGGAGAADGAFKRMLQEQIDTVNQLQTDAQMAMEDINTGRRDDFETVIAATQKADTAFRMLLQVRNKVMDALEEVKQIRV